MLALLPVALAYESPPQEVVFADEATLFTAVEYDTGNLPEGSPVWVAFRIEVDGGAAVEMLGESVLTWPDALTHSYVPTHDGGTFALDSTITAKVVLGFDIDIYSAELDLGSESLSFYDATLFTPWALPGGNPEEVSVTGEGEETLLFDIEQSVYTGVSIYLETWLHPEANATFNAMRIATGDQLIENDGETESFPPDGLTAFDEDAVMKGHYDGTLDLILTPAFGVCIDIIGCVEIAAFEIPINLVGSYLEQEFAPVFLHHPLPYLALEEEAYDFGEVTLGQHEAKAITFDNLGEMELEGDLWIEGDGAYMVYPDTIYVPSGGTDGVTIDYEPGTAGAHEAVLVIESSDPSKPRVEIPLTGTGLHDTDPTDDPDDVDEGEEAPENFDTGQWNYTEVISSEVTCGCAKSSGGKAGWLVLLAAPLVVSRRRRS